MKISSWIRCNIFKHHNWTSAIQERGGKPQEGLDTAEKLIAAVRKDARLYCKDCKRESELNKRLNF